MPEISVLIPTYNERENIESLIDRIEEVLSEKDYEILIIDDSSPDGTAEVVRSLEKENVKVFEREGKKGIGSAYKFAFEKAKGDKIVQMDADFSHDPKHIIDLIQALDEGFDVAVGSRYVEGGKRNDPLRRKIFPKLGNFLFKSLLGIDVKDITSGFKAYKKNCLKLLEEEKLPDNFSFQAASLYQLSVNGVEIKEVPIVFKERKSGETKYSNEELLGNIKLLSNLVFKRHFGKRFFKFCTVGLIGVFVNMGMLWSLTEFLKIFYLLSALIAVETSIFANFALNESWTWKEVGEDKLRKIVERFLKFNLVSAGGLTINLLILGFLTSVLGIFYIISNIGGIGGAVMWNFFMNKKWTWSSDEKPIF